MGHPWFDVIFEDGRSKTVALAEKYRALAGFLKIPFFDAGSVISTGGVDGIHLTEETTGCWARRWRWRSGKSSRHDRTA